MGPGFESQPVHEKNKPSNFGRLIFLIAMLQLLLFFCKLYLSRMLIIERHINEIEKLCLENKVKSLYVFGSVLNETFNSQSDIDLVVDFNNIEIADYADNYYNLKFGLQSIFHRQIDLLEQKAIKNPYFLQQLNLQKKLVYGY